MRNADIANSSSGTDILGLAERRMSWLQNRQQVLASNVANADTPNYTSKDTPSFDNALNQFNISLETTSTDHLPGTMGSANTIQERTEEKSLNGNNVALEAQMEKIADNSDQQKFAASVYSSWRSMFSTVIGR
ncbi:MAG: flagellar basal body rod protein FlgB [Acetobacter sp.]|jgi:flagellar basal-body rod protein FlgB